VLALLALIMVALLQRQWLAWSAPQTIGADFSPAMAHVE
jgi:hypothetical protein